MNSKKKITEAENPASKKPKQVDDMEDTPSLQDLYKILLQVAQDVGEVKLTLADLNSKTGQLDGRVSALEQSSSSMSTEIAGSYRAYNNLKSELQKEKDSRLGMEMRLRAKNIRLVGVADHTGNEDSVDLALEVFKDSFKCDLVSSCDIDTAYRIGKEAGPKPRHILVTFLNQRTKERLISAARLRGSASFRGKPVSIYPDYPREVLLIRKSFQGAKDLARQLHLKAFLNKNCVFTIVLPDGEKSSADPMLALQWLEQYKKNLESTDQ